MGVSGAGKTTVGEALASELGWRFYEGDDFHSAHNVELMASGHPLTDEDRAPWLAALAKLISNVIDDGGHAVLACSALRHQYREELTNGGLLRGRVAFVFLEVSPEVLDTRLRERTGHYMTAKMLDSQLRTLEAPRDAIRVDGTLPVDEIVKRVIERTGARSS
jgi:gluconokinase